MLNFESDLAQVGGSEVRYIAFCNILAEKITYLKIFLRDFCFVMKITNYKSTWTVREPKQLQFKFYDLFNEHFPLLFFSSKVFCRRNTGEMEVTCY